MNVTDERRRWLALALLCPALALAQVRTFLVGETMDYTIAGAPAGCMNTDLNIVTESLANELVATGWTGNRFTNGNTFPQDYMETCSSIYGTSGNDLNWADSRTLAVYAGHGNTGLLQWGTPILGRCTIDFSNNMRLGQMAGAQAAYAIWLTSCTLRLSTLPSEANFQFLHQQMGYNNSPRIAGWSAGNFYLATLNWNNRDAWLEHMDDPPFFWQNYNSPVSVSYAPTWNECINIANTASLRGGVLLTPASGGPVCGGNRPAGFYCYWLRDNPSSECGP